MYNSETYYLIDYENVNSDGLIGCNQLGNSDHIIIFFTSHAKKIDMSEIANHGGAHLEMIEVPAGKQSTDIHIGSYLGYLAAKYEGRVCNAAIISKDTDFDNIIIFWKNKTGIKASRVQKIKDLIIETSFMASRAVKSLNDENIMHRICKAIVAKYKQNQVFALYNNIKKRIRKNIDFTGPYFEIWD